MAVFCLLRIIVVDLIRKDSDLVSLGFFSSPAEQFKLLLYRFMGRYRFDSDLRAINLEQLARNLAKTNSARWGITK